MAEVTWGKLAKAVDDKQTVEEEIDEKIKTHTEDASAHKQTGEAIDTHRTGLILDHPSESVTNIKIFKRARFATAIVDAAGDGDYTTIQPAIDYVNGLGGGKILILPATYTLTDDLILYDDIEMFGLKASECILDFANNKKLIKVIGDTAFYETGTIGVTNNSKVVSGVGTSWLANIAAGEFIYIEDVLYEIGSVDNDLQLTLVNKYYGPTKSGLGYQVAAFKKNIVLRDLRITRGGNGDLFSEQPSLDIYFVKDSKFFNLITDNSLEADIWCQRSYNVDVNDNYIAFSAAIGLWIQEVIKSRFKSNQSDGHFYHGIGIGHLAKKNDIEGNLCSHNNEYGIYTLGKLNNISKNKTSNNVKSGIMVGSGGVGEEEEIVDNISEKNGEDGINAQSERNNLKGNICKDNTRDGVRVEGANGDNNILNGNVCKDNTGYGVKIKDATCERNSIIANQLAGNTADAIDDSGTSTEIGHNIET